MKKESFLDFLKEKNYPFGFVSVELDKTSLKPNTTTSRKVFYFLRPARRPQAPYIVFFNGGPGMAASEMFLNFNYEIFLPDYNVVFFDQRGNGLSFG
ncbi:MAG: alpha/beta hydrolase family protein, partial [Parachlamydiales bacterium]